MSRCRFLLIAVGALVPMAGCQGPPKRTPMHPVPLGTSVQMINANVARVTGTLRASGPVDGEAVVEQGRKSSFHADGVLFFLQPRYLRFDVKKFGERQFLFGSNAEQYWVFSKADGEYFCGRHDRLEDLPPDLPVRPDQLADALALAPFDVAGDTPIAQRVTDEYQQLLFLGTDDFGNIRVEKEYWVDRCAPRVVRRVIFRDADGVIEMESLLDDYRIQEDGSLYLPHRVHVRWPQAEMSLTLDVTQWRLVPQVKPDGPQFSAPSECRPYRNGPTSIREGSR